MGAVAELPKRGPAQASLPIAPPTKRTLKVMTKNITLPADVEYDQHDEFEVTLRCRIEKVVNDAPLDEYGHVKHSTVIAHAKVLEYVGEDFKVESDPSDPEPPAAAPALDDEGDDE